MGRVDGRGGGLSTAIDRVCQVLDLGDLRQRGSLGGVPAGAKTISLSNPDFVAAVEVELGSDKTRPVAVICRAGNRSVRAADALAAAGFTNVTNVADGMLGRDDVGPGWLGSNLATQAYPIQ